MPGEQRRRGHREHLAPPAAGNQSRQCRQPQAVPRLIADPANLAAEHRVLVPEHQELGILGHLALRQHHQAAEQTTNDQVDDRNDHSAMIPAGKPVHVRSSNRAPQALAQPGRRRVRGIAACSLFTALLLIAANIRKIRAWRARTASDRTATAQRARRRRASLRDYLPDG